MLAETRIGRALFTRIRNLERGVRPGALISCLKNTHDNIPDGRNAPLTLRMKRKTFDTRRASLSFY